jgi:hypothetical protein
MPAIPKRSTERRRTNKVPGLEQVAVAGPVKVPPAVRGWHPLARDWYKSLALSGQARYYEPSDWQTARLLADQMSRLLNAEDPNASMLNAIIQASRDLLTTEGQRRRLRLELTREVATSDPAADAASADVDNIISLAVARA